MTGVQTCALPISSSLSRIGVWLTVVLSILSELTINVGPLLAGAGVLGAALAFGADDMGSVMIEENMVSAAGTTHRTTTDELVHLIRALGKTPVQRDTLYREVRAF